MSNQLRLYFSSWFKDQHHSISGFIHITSSLSPQKLETKLPLAEWLQTYQYSIPLCKSQDEEKSLIGALCYGSLYCTVMDYCIVSQLIRLGLL
jgi:hypothetical protein